MSRPSRTTFYRGTRMRSRLEADYAAALDRDGYWSWEYEPHVFADQRGQYLPDFRLAKPGMRLVYIELKPAELLDDERARIQALTRLSIVWSSEPDAVLRLVGWRWGSEQGHRPEIIGYAHPETDAIWHRPSWWWSCCSEHGPLDGAFRATLACRYCAPTSDAPAPDRDLDAEGDLLGLMLRSPEALTLAHDELGLIRADFSVLSHRVLFEIISALRAHGRIVSAPTVTAELDARGWLTAVGGRRAVETQAASSLEDAATPERILSRATAVIEATARRGEGGQERLKAAKRILVAARRIEAARLAAEAEEHTRWQQRRLAHERNRAAEEQAKRARADTLDLSELAARDAETPPR